MVAAVALAGVQALFCLLPGLTGCPSASAASPAAFVVESGSPLLLSAATVLGSVQLFRGRDARLLQVVGLVLVAVWLVNVVLGVAVVGSIDVLSVLLLVLAAGVVVATRRPEVREFTA